jgi:hypothetical protein
MTTSGNAVIYNSMTYAFRDDYQHFHTYKVGDGCGQVSSDMDGHIASVIWYRDEPWGVLLETVFEGQVSNNPHYDWRLDPSVIVSGVDDVCYVCAEGCGDFDAAEIIVGEVLAHAHNACASAAVTSGQAVWAD